MTITKRKRKFTRKQVTTTEFNTMLDAGTVKQVWMRTCQECGLEQISREPKTDAQLYKECESCHSEALDYGHNPFFSQIEAGTIIETDWTE